jgi:chitodextrinase
MRVIGTLALAGAGGDTQAPTVPQGLIATAVNAGRVDLTWNASTDNVGVAGYQVFRNDVPLTTTAATNHSDITAQPSTLYAYSVAAFDATGNDSTTSLTRAARYRSPRRLMRHRRGWQCRIKS